MHMIGDAHEETDPDLVVALLGPGEGPDDDLVQLGTGTEQETALEGPAGHLDQSPSFGDETESSAHTPEDGKSAPKLIRPRTAWVCEGGKRAFSVFQNRRSMGDLPSSRLQRGAAGGFASSSCSAISPRTAGGARTSSASRRRRSNR